MTIDTKPNLSKTLVFMSTDFFCSVSNVEAMARYFNVPEELKSSFCHGLNSAYIHLLLNKSLRDKPITKEVIIKTYSTSIFLPRCLKALNISTEKVVEAMENPDLYSYVKGTNCSKVFATIKHLYESGYDLILRDDKPESILAEVLRQMDLLQYFKSVQGLIGNYFTFSVKSMEKLIGSNNPTDFIVVTSGEGKTSIINAAKKVGIPVMICKQFDIAELM